jgi:hypothetical protein
LYARPARRQRGQEGQCNVASISTRAGGRRLIQLTTSEGKRKTIRLGKVPADFAEEVQARVETLLTAARLGLSWDAATARWVAGLAPALADKLAAVGLIPPRPGAAPAESKAEAQRQPLKAFLDAYIAGRSGDAKPGTLTAMKTGAARLVKYFQAERELASITPGDADEWARWLLKHHAAATAGRTVKWARQLFRAAVRKRLIPENPFADVKAPGVANEERKHFVGRQTAAQILDACPDAEWQLIFALSRFGGLRCPLEHLALAGRGPGAGPLPGHQPQDGAPPG